MTGDLRPYPEYKDTGLPWLGRVPAHWDVMRCKYLFREVDERSKTGEETHLSMSQQHGLIPSKDLDGRRLHSESYVGAKLCQTNDLVLNRLKAHLGVFAHARQPGLVSPDYTVLRPVHSDDVVYFEHVFKTPPCVAELRCSTKGIVEGFWRLYTDDFYNIRVPVPPETERTAILSFVRALDAKVRRFIRNRRRLIEVLTEPKQASINRAVTRGLDPNAPLKPSGIDWLGDIPEHWIVKPLKRWVSINERVLPETTDPEYSFDYLDIGCVGTGRLVGKPSRITFGDAPSRARRIIQRGDTIISTVRTYLRAVWFVAEDVSDLVASTGFAVLSPREGVVPEYLGLTLQSDPFINRVTANSIGIAYPAIAETRLGTFHVAMPPDADEQRAIVKRVQDETATLTTWIERTQREIDLIREYRTRLIADVVTGKVDVRQASAEGVAKQANRHANIHFRRTVFAAEIVHRLHDEPTFGHVKFEKLIFLCEKWCGVETGSTYYRQAAGPYDNRALRSIDSQLKKQRWYEAQKGDKGYRYIRLEKAGEHKKYFDRYFGSVISRFDEIIDLFRHARTEQCEIIATIYAAWEDLLTQGSATDEQIIEQVLHHWHPSKQKISEDRWRKALGWMKEKGLTPRTEATCADN